MKYLVAVVAVLAFGCKSGDKKPPPAPTPTETGSGSATVVASGSGSDSMAGSGSGSAACVIHVTLTQTNVAWDGGGIKGQTDFKPGEPAHLDALKGLGKCAAWLVADDKMVYQDVISVMDALIKLGITNVSLGKPSDQPTPAPDITSKLNVGSDGKLDLGTVDNAAALQKAPLLIITKTEVRLHDKVVGKPDDDKLVASISAVLPEKPADPTLIIQADKDTSAKTINRVITAASNQGYTNVLFAVKTK